MAEDDKKVLAEINACLQLIADKRSGNRTKKLFNRFLLLCEALGWQKDPVVRAVNKSLESLKDHHIVVLDSPSEQVPSKKWRLAEEKSIIQKILAFLRKKKRAYTLRLKLKQ